jgi:hypothetical protein
VHILLPTIVFGILMHEGLHWLGYVGCAQLPRKTVRFGFKLRSFAAYVHADSPVRISAYRCLVALPGVILGVVPVFVGIGWESASITLYGFLMLVGASGDFAILWKIRHVPPESYVLDHPYRAGCWVLVERPEENSRSSHSEKRDAGTPAGY